MRWERNTITHTIKRKLALQTGYKKANGYIKGMPVVITPSGRVAT